MNQGIELHDSVFSDISFVEDTAVVSFSHAYVHRSSGVPGTDVGSGWSQPATLTFASASLVASPAGLPLWISNGFLRIGQILHNNLIPASGRFDGGVELSLVLTSGETFTIRGQSVTTELHAELSYIEEFKP